MKVKLLVCVMAFFCVTVKAQNKKTCCSSKYTDETLSTLSTLDLSREYKRLKRKHCKDCSLSTSGLVWVMTELGKKLDGKSREEIKRMMGDPDLLEGERWIYSWRSKRDYLYFDFTGDVGKANWYNAWD